VLRRLLPALASLAVAVAVGAASAQAGPKLFVGFADDWLKRNPPAAVLAARDLGATSFRISLNWSYGQTTLSAADERTLDAAIPAAFGLRVVVTVVGAAARFTPHTGSSRAAYCSYIRNVLDRYPTINDVIVWNEPNKTYAWKPQFDRKGASLAPAEYETLLARCYDVLHSYRPEVNVLAPATSPTGNDNYRAVSNISHSPGAFVRELGAAYRKSGRTEPIFDTVAHHMYGATPSERPWRRHAGPMIAQGDWAKLVNAYKSAFAGTEQPVPGRCIGTKCVPIWYMEAGYQTSLDSDKKRLYRFTENIPRVVADRSAGEADSARPAPESPAPDQATQVRDGIRLAYCQPYVEAFFNYLLRDDADLRGWQSGALWRDGTRKDSFGAFRSAIAEAADGEVDCDRLKGGPAPKG